MLSLFRGWGYKPDDYPRISQYSVRNPACSQRTQHSILDGIEQTSTMSHKPCDLPIINVPCPESPKDEAGDFNHKITIIRTRTIEKSYLGNAPDGPLCLLPDKTSLKITLPGKNQRAEHGFSHHQTQYGSSRSVTAKQGSTENQDFNLDHLADELLEQLGFFDDENSTGLPCPRRGSKAPEQQQQQQRSASTSICCQASFDAKDSAAFKKSAMQDVNPHLPASEPQDTFPSMSRKEPQGSSLKSTNAISAGMATESVRSDKNSAQLSSSSKNSYALPQKDFDEHISSVKVNYSSLDGIYADIIDYSNYRPCIRALRPPGNSNFMKLLRRIKKFANLRLAAGVPTVKATEHDEPLGVLLAPPSGSTHFEVQLTISGLLRRNAACAYELYNFYLQNGFFKHLSNAPAYETWSADFHKAIAAEHPFYREGIRVGITGEMDYLRDVYESWIEAWLDWRLARPIPS